MSPATSLRCPHCGYSAQSAKPISLGAAPAANPFFRFTPSDGGSAQPLRAVEAERLQELFAGDNKPKTAPPSREIGIRVLSDSNDGLPPRSAGPLPVTIKKPTLDGKPLPFHGPRTMVAAGLLAVSALVAYGAIRWYLDTVISLDATAAKAGAKRKAMVQTLAEAVSARDLKARGALAKTSSAGSPGTVAPVALAQATTRTVAPCQGIGRQDTRSPGLAGSEYSSAISA